MAINLDGNGLNTTGLINSATAQASTSGTSIDFTGIPSGVRRVTVMFSGVSTSGSSASVCVQIGSGSVDTSGYTSGSYYAQTTASNGFAAQTSAFIIYWTSANAARTGVMRLNLMNASTNLWVAEHAFYIVDTTSGCVWGAGSKTLSGVIDRVRITTSNGTDTFDAGTINILYE